MGQNSDSNDLLIKLATVEQQLRNNDENSKKILDVTKEIFSKIDDQSKDLFSAKSDLSTLKETTALKFKEVDKYITEIKDGYKNIADKINDIDELIDDKLSIVNETIDKNKNAFEKFKIFIFQPIADTVQKFRVIYPIISILLVVIAILVSIYFGVAK